MNLEYIQGDAEHLTQHLPNGSVDILIDIESNFFYLDKRSFLKEAALVLKEEEGIFLLSVLDFRTRMEAIHREIKRHFYILVEEDATDCVLKALHLDGDNIQRGIDRKFPIGLNSIMKQLAGVEGTVINTWLANRVLLYKSFVLKKRKQPHHQAHY